MVAQTFSPKSQRNIFANPEIADKELLSEVKQVLKKHNALNRFGLGLINYNLEISNEEVLIETTNMKNRDQLIKPYPMSDYLGKEAIETSWSLKTGQAVMSCKCVKEGNSHEHYERG